METKKITAKFYYVITVVIALALVVIVNVISNLSDFRLDFTEDQRYSLTNSTQDFLSSDSLLNERILFKIYLEGEELPAEASRLKKAIQGKLDEFKYYAGKRVEYEFINPNTGTEADFKELSEQLIAKGKGIRPITLNYRSEGKNQQIFLFPGAVVSYKGSISGYVRFMEGGQSYLDQNFENKVQRAITNIEYKLMEAIDKATRRTKKTIGFLGGHGELKPQNTAAMRNILEETYIVKDVIINGRINALDNLDGLVIADPKKAFSDKDKFVIDQYLMQGGNLLLTYNPLYINRDTLKKYGQVNSIRKKTDIEKLTYDYGIKINDDLLVDAQYGAFIVSPRSQPIPYYFYMKGQGTEHPIASQLDPIMLFYASSLQFVKTDNQTTPSVLLTTSSNAKSFGIAPLVSLGMFRAFGEQPKFQDDINNPNNRLMVGAMVEGNFESAFKNRLVDAYKNNTDAVYYEKSQKPGKLCVFSSGNFFQNKYFDSVEVLEENRYKYIPRYPNERIGEFDEILLGGSKGNFDVIQNTLDYMLGESSLLAVRSRTIDLHPTDKNKVTEQAGFYKVINLIIPICSVILLALTLIFIRNRKFTRK